MLHSHAVPETDFLSTESTISPSFTMSRTIHEHSASSGRDKLLGRFVFQPKWLSRVCILAAIFFTLTTSFWYMIVVKCPVEERYFAVGVFLFWMVLVAFFWYTVFATSTKKFYENGFELIQYGSTRTIMYDQVKGFSWQSIQGTTGGKVPIPVTQHNFTIFLNDEDDGGRVRTIFQSWLGIQKYEHISAILLARIAMRMFREIAEQGETTWTSVFFSHHPRS